MIDDCANRSDESDLESPNIREICLFNCVVLF